MTLQELIRSPNGSWAILCGRATASAVVARSSSAARVVSPRPSNDGRWIFHGDVADAFAGVDDELVDVVPVADALAAMDVSGAMLEPVPSSVTARQIRLWLVRHGVGLAAVDAAIDAIPDAITRDSVRVEWEYAPYVERSHQMLVPLAAALGLTEDQIDAAFREAAGL